MIVMKTELPSTQMSTPVNQLEVGGKQPEIEPTKKAADKSKYERQCRSVMGDVGALLFFTYAALRQEWTMDMLALWSRMLRDAINSETEVFRSARTDATGKALLSRNTKIEKPQVSVWKTYSPLTTKFPRCNSLGWIYRLVNVPVVGERKEVGKWSGNLISIMELKTGALFHHFISESKSFRLSQLQVFYVIAEVDKRMSSHPDAAIYAQHPRELFLPECSPHSQESTFESHLQEVYNGVFQMFTDFKESSDPVLVEFMSAEQSIVFSNWRAHTYPQAISPFQIDVKANPLLSQVTKTRKDKRGNPVKLKNTIDTADHLNGAICRIASRMDKEFLKYRIVVEGTWKSLNKPSTQ
jgi:hypothetical protein